MIFYDNSGYSNAPCCYVIHTVPLVFKFSSSSSCTSSGFSSWPPQLVSPPSLPFHSSIHHSLRILVLSVFSRGWARHLHSSNPKLFFGNSVETFSVGAASPASRRPPKWPSGWLLHASYPTRYSVCLQEGGDMGRGCISAVCLLKLRPSICLFYVQIKWLENCWRGFLRCHSLEIF